MTDEVSAAMATRDLMSAALALQELPPELVWQEYEDIELVCARLEKLLTKLEEVRCAA